MVPLGVAIVVALVPVDRRLGRERLGGLVREQRKREPRGRALFVFVAKPRQTVKRLVWDGTDTVLATTTLDRGLFERPAPERPGDPSAVVSDAVFEALLTGLSLQVTPGRSLELDEASLSPRVASLSDRLSALERLKDTGELSRSSHASSNNE